MERLASLDAGFLTLESPRVFTHIGSIMIMDQPADGRLDADAISERIAARLHRLPPFRRRLVEVPLGLGQPYWAEDPDFDLDYHVRESALPAPGDEHRLADMVARTFSRPLDRTRPLWEMWVVHGLEHDRIAIITKIHHAAVDGVSGTELLSVLLDEAEEDDDQGARPWRGERIPSELELLARGALDLALGPARALRAAPGALGNLALIPGVTVVPGVPTMLRLLDRLTPGENDDLLETSTAQAPDTPFNGPITAHRRFAWGGVGLDRCKAVKDAAGVKLNDVVVTLCAASIRAWLEQRDALPADPLLAAIPVSVRADDDGDEYGNRIGMMAGPIATHLADPVERLRWTAHALTSTKDRHGALPADVLTDATHFVPPAMAALAARTTLNLLSRLRSPLNVLVSNVPGPREPLHCLGAEVQGLYAVPPIVDGLGLNITVVSYRDELGIGIITDREQIEDPWELLAGLETALEELEAALVRT